MVRQDELKIRTSPILAPFGHECEVASLGHVEIDPDVPLRVDPARIGLLDGCGLRLDDGDRDLPGVVLRLPPKRMALGQGERRSTTG